MIASQGNINRWLPCRKQSWCEGRHSCNGKRQSLANEVYEQLSSRKIPRKLTGKNGAEGRKYGESSPKGRKGESEREDENRIRVALSPLFSRSNRVMGPRKAEMVNNALAFLFISLTLEECWFFFTPDAVDVFCVVYQLAREFPIDHFFLDFFSQDRL